MKAWQIYLISVPVVTSLLILFLEGTGKGLEYDITTTILETLILGVFILGIYYLIKSERKRRKAKESLK